MRLKNKNHEKAFYSIPIVYRHNSRIASANLEIGNANRPILLTGYIAAKHLNLFAKISRSDFEKSIVSLDARIDTLDEESFLQKFSKSSKP